MQKEGRNSGYKPVAYVKLLWYNKSMSKKGKWYVERFDIQCSQCGRTRRVSGWYLRKLKNISLCGACRTNNWNKLGGVFSSNWKGGHFIDSNGYLLIRTYPGDLFFSMVNIEGYIFEHRLVMAKSLGRCLKPSEIVHHKNGIRLDNRLENLEITTRSLHTSRGYAVGYKKGYEVGFAEAMSGTRNMS